MATQVFLKGSEVLYHKNQEWSLYINLSIILRDPVVEPGLFSLLLLLCELSVSMKENPDRKQTETTGDKLNNRSVVVDRSAFLYSAIRLRRK